jgi:glutaredoxin-dependent peroxiredoxin
MIFIRFFKKLCISIENNYAGNIVAKGKTMKIEVGQAAPDFSLFNTEKKEVHLKDYKGSQVLLLFFPLAFTSVCTTELCSVRDSMKIYENLNVNVFGISVDSLYTLAVYKKHQKLNFDLLSDFNKEVSSKYGSIYPQFDYGMKGVSKRSAFLINKNGEVEYAEVLEDADKIPDFESILRILS